MALVIAFYGFPPAWMPNPEVIMLSDTKGKCFGRDANKKRGSALCLPGKQANTSPTPNLVTFSSVQALRRMCEGVLAHTRCSSESSRHQALGTVPWANKNEIWFIMWRLHNSRHNTCLHWYNLFKIFQLFYLPLTFEHTDIRALRPVIKLETHAV